MDCPARFVGNTLQPVEGISFGFLACRARQIPFQNRVNCMLGNNRLLGFLQSQYGHSRLFCQRKSVLPVVALLSKSKEVEPSDMRLWQLGEGQSQLYHELPSGLKLEVIVQRALNEGQQKKTPLVMAHGSYHAAWCWALLWMPFFAARGHACYAVSFLGQGASDSPSGDVAGSIESHAGDLAHFINHTVSEPPVLVGHSFGGLIVQWYLSHMHTNPAFSPVSIAEGLDTQYPRLAGAVLACSVPPTGNGGVVMRYLRRKPLASIKITFSLAAKWFAVSLSLCRETFFSPNLPNSQVLRYQKLLKESSRLPLFDLRKLNATLPVPKPTADLPPVLVLAAQNDFIVDMEGAQETGEFYGVEPVVIPDIGHDIMLDVAWETAAAALDSWLETSLLGKVDEVKAEKFGEGDNRQDKLTVI